jgi:modification methylase
LSKKTKTSNFGVSKRESHDSSDFYGGRLYSSLTQESKEIGKENIVEEHLLDQIFCKSSERMEELPNNSIDLGITSPPYNVKKSYDDDLTLQEYLEFLRRIFIEVKRVLVPGGRFCINLADLGRRPYIPLTSYVSIMLVELGFLLRGEIIWRKTGVSGSSCAWGSWKMASNPVLRDCHEKILVCCKDTYKRESKGKTSTITRDEFLRDTLSVWDMPCESARRVKHPAPFSVQLPERLISLYSFLGDIVLDPFMGSGTTAVAAIRSGRHYVGYELDENYVKLSEERIKKEKDSK